MKLGSGRAYSVLRTFRAVPPSGVCRSQVSLRVWPPPPSSGRRTPQGPPRTFSVCGPRAFVRACSRRAWRAACSPGPCPRPESPASRSLQRGGFAGGPGRARPQLDPPAGAARGPRGRGRVAAGSNRSVPSRAGGRAGSRALAERRALRRRRRGERGPGRGAHLPVTATAEASIVPGRAARDAACTGTRPRAPGPGRPGRGAGALCSRGAGREAASGRGARTASVR